MHRDPTKVVYSTADRPICPHCNKVSLPRTSFDEEGAGAVIPHRCQHCDRPVLTFVEEDETASAPLSHETYEGYREALRVRGVLRKGLRQRTGAPPEDERPGPNAGGRPRREDRIRVVLEVLTLERFEGAGASASAWRAMAGERGVPERTFFSYLPDVIDAGWVQRTTGERPRYVLTPAGVLQLTATAITVSAVAVHHTGEEAA